MDIKSLHIAERHTLLAGRLRVVTETFAILSPTMVTPADLRKLRVDLTRIIDLIQEIGDHTP